MLSPHACPLARGSCSPSSGHGEVATPAVRPPLRPAGAAVEGGQWDRAMALSRRGLSPWPPQRLVGCRLVSCPSSFALSASEAPTQQSGLCAQAQLSPSMSPSCLLVPCHPQTFLLGQSPSEHLVLMPTPCLQAQRMLVRGQLRLLSLGPSKGPSFPVLLWRVGELKTTLRSIEWPGFASEIRPCAFEYPEKFSNPTVDWNPTGQGHAQNEDRTDASLSRSAHLHTRKGRTPHTPGLEFLPCHFWALFLLSPSDYSLWQQSFHLENGANNLMSTIRSLKNETGSIHTWYNQISRLSLSQASAGTKETRSAIFSRTSLLAES